MSLPQFVFVTLAVAALARLAYAQPEVELRGAITGLIEAGNYTWEQTEEVGRQAGQAISRTNGVTIVDGFTRGRIGQVDAVRYQQETAYALARGWKYYRDISEEERTELRRRGVLVTRGFPATQPLPHEVLTLVIEAVRDVRQDQTALVAEIDPDLLDGQALDEYLRTGRRPKSRGTKTGSLLGLPVQVARSNAVRSGTQVRLTLFESAGVVERFEIRLWRAALVLNGPDAGEQERPVRNYRVQIADVGRTKPQIPVEARALFLSAPKGP